MDHANTTTTTNNNNLAADDAARNILMHLQAQLLDGSLIAELSQESIDPRRLLLDGTDYSVKSGNASEESQQHQQSQQELHDLLAVENIVDGKPTGPSAPFDDLHTPMPITRSLSIRAIEPFQSFTIGPPAIVAQSGHCSRANSAGGNGDHHSHNYHVSHPRSSHKRQSFNSSALNSSTSNTGSHPPPLPGDDSGQPIPLKPQDLDLQLQQMHLLDSFENVAGDVASPAQHGSKKAPSTLPHVSHATNRPTTAKRSKILADIRITAQEFLESGAIAHQQHHNHSHHHHKNRHSTNKRNAKSIVPPNQLRLSANTQLNNSKTHNSLQPASDIQKTRLSTFISIHVPTDDPTSTGNIKHQQLNPQQTQQPQPDFQTDTAAATIGSYDTRQQARESTLSNTQTHDPFLDIQQHPLLHPLYNRPIVPHDYGDPALLGTHNHRCQHLPPGTILSHLAKSARCRRSIFGESNRIAFLSAMGAAERSASGLGGGCGLLGAGGGAAAGGGGSGLRGGYLPGNRQRDRAVRRFWPEVEPADALGLTLCGSASGEGRILEAACTYGKERDESRMPPIPKSDFKAARPSFTPPESLQKKVRINSDQLRHIAMKFKDLLTPENSPNNQFPNVIQLSTASSDTGHLKVNTRYSANTQWYHQTKYDVEATSESHFCSEKTRFAHEPWFDDQQQQRKIQFKAKLRNLVRDKNVGELGTFVK
ncbi:hypothetical protein BDR26DRAFT_1008228 [Obelidium mucronatum]|nr:hypothetical protein BDR26DRAFT_1008228 [Obelidium mucronatum]